MSEEARLIVSAIFWVAGFIAGYSCPFFHKSWLRTMFYPSDKE